MHSSKHLKGVSKLASISFSINLGAHLYLLPYIRLLEECHLSWLKKHPIISSNYGYAIVHAKISSQTQNKKGKEKR